MVKRLERLRYLNTDPRLRRGNGYRVRIQLLVGDRVRYGWRTRWKGGLRSNFVVARPRCDRKSRPTHWESGERRFYARQRSATDFTDGKLPLWCCTRHSHAAGKARCSSPSARWYTGELE